MSCITKINHKVDTWLEKLEKYIEQNYYVCEDGKLRRLHTYKQWKKDSEVGSYVGLRGYKVIRILGKTLFVHRIIYWLCNNKWPDLIDHIDGVKTNNRIENLREGCKVSNALNLKKPHVDNELGIMGVIKRKDTGKYSARFRNKSLGCFDTPEEAERAYLEHKQKEVDCLY